jgi:hypothetical protein
VIASSLLLGAACDEGGDDEPSPPPDETTGVFQTETLLVSGGLIPGTSDTATAYRALAVGDGRKVAIEADLSGSGTALLLVGDEAGNPIVVAKTGQSLPGTATPFDSVVPEVVSDFANENVYVDSLNRLVFMAQDAGGVVLGIYRRGLTGGLTALVSVGDTVDSDTIATIQPHLAASPTGLVAFIGTLNGSGLTAVFCRKDDGTLHTVATEGDTLPGSTAVFNANFAHVFVNDRDHFFLNGRGGIVYTVEASDGTTAVLTGE